MAVRSSLGVIEDQEILLELLAELCAKQLGYEVCFTATSAATALMRLRDCNPDALLIDITLPDGDGIELAKRLRKERSALKVILISGDARPEVVRRIREAGLHGYVSKFSWSTCLRQALENVLEHGKTYFSPVVQGADSPYAKMLTQRERQVLPFMAIGHTDGEIAGMGDMSPATVRKHRERIMQKLDLKSRADLLNFCFKGGFLKTAPDGSLIVPQWANSSERH